MQADNYTTTLLHADNIRTSQPEHFSRLIKHLNQRTSKLSKPQHQHLTYLNMFLYIFEGKLDEAESTAAQLLNSDANAELKMRTRLSLVSLYASSENWPKGLSLLTEVFNNMPSSQDENIHQAALITSSIFYNQLGEYELGLSYAKKVTTKTTKTTKTRNLCIAKKLEVESLFNLRRLVAEDPLIEQSIKLCKKSNELLAINFINFYLAQFLYYQGEIKQAIQVLNSNLQTVKNNQYPRISADYYALLALINIEINNLSQAKGYALKAIQYTKNSSSKKAKVIAYKVLYKLAANNENHSLTIQYLSKYYEADKEHFTDVQAKGLAFQLAQHKSLEQQNKIELLREKNALLISEQALAKIKVENIQLFIAILTITIALLLLWAGRLWKSHKRVKQLAEYDTLTGIFSRGHFTQITTSALSYCKNAEQPLSLIMFDLDFFKKVNDSYGHACGDWVLKEVVRVCQAIGRTNDIFARVGGEEFCLVLPSCQLSAAIERAEACRAAIGSINTSLTGHNFSVSASFGVTDVKNSGYTLDKLLANADLATYQAKNSGRNKVSVYK